MHSDRIAIVGIGLAYPDAETPTDLWNNVLGGRRAFRRLPPGRMNLADYWDPDPSAEDKFYSSKAAVLRDYSFDRVSRRISTATLESTDMTHWLALDVAERALVSAGFGQGEGLPHPRTGVILGNTLTGEFSRANVMRLRWPYVRRVLAGQLRELDWSTEQVDEFVSKMELSYKAPFPRVTEDTLAGGLANTIAGRICNFYDFGGGGYTVDGACSSSLLSVIHAARALRSGDLDVALAGGVDLSIDPFEVIGFAKTGALAKDVMKIYDRDSNGFWPGEGAGMIVLMREEDARAQDKPVFAVISGWGMSSDGRGGITRPDAEGHRRAIEQAYERAGYGPETVGYFEGHGTGTAVGDATEIRALATTRDGVSNPVPAALSSVKANIGHTKAAAGVAGLIKAAMAVHHQVIPPATGHVEAHPDLVANAHALYVPDRALPWPEELPVRAGVSAMGFGGINTHIALESADPARARVIAPVTAQTVNSRQDAEVLLFEAADTAALRERLAAARELLDASALCELTDLAVSLQRSLTHQEHRLGIVATSPEEAIRRIRVAEAALAKGMPTDQLLNVGEGCWYRGGTHTGRLAFAFPGQGAGIGTRGAVARRYYPDCGVNDRDSDATEIVQPRIVKRSLQAMEVLRSIGVDADVAVGHSLGELTALAWAGCLEYQSMERVAARRGQMMSELIPAGAMAVVAADATTTEGLLDGTGALISGYNAPTLTVVAGSEHAVAQCLTRAAAAGESSTRLSVEHPFHTPDCADAADAFAEHLTQVPFGPPGRQVVSSCTGQVLPTSVDLGSHLAEQITSPVRFTQAVEALGEPELIIELGPGRVLGGLISQISPETAVVSADTDSTSLAPMMEAIAAAFALGRVRETKEIYRNRLYRQLELGQSFTFLTNPCERAPELDYAPTLVTLPVVGGEEALAQTDDLPPDARDADTLQVLREAVASKVDLPLDVIHPETRPLDDLHLSSITVGQIVNDVLNTLERGHLAGVPAFATATLAEIAVLLDDLSGGDDGRPALAGIGPWVRAFAPEAHPGALLESAPSGASQWRLVGERTEEAEQLLSALRRRANPGQGVLLAVQRDELNLPVSPLLETIEALAAEGPGTSLVVLDCGGNTGAALAKTIFLEKLAATVTVIEAPPAQLWHEQLVASMCADVSTNGSFLEVRYPDAETRVSDTWSVLPDPEAEPAPHLGESDVILVTGGGKGITAECALSLAEHSGAAVALMGRAPDSDGDVSKTLKRARALGLKHCYVRADVADRAQVAAALATVRQELGEITAVIHGAGRNEPKSAAELTREDFDLTLGPKILGLRNILDGVEKDKLVLLVAFTSIIGRAGLHGEAHYATANSWLTNEVVEYGEHHPHTRVRSIEWSVWSGAGMGERLGVVESLQRNGIEPIPSDWGVELFRRLVDDPQVPPVVVAAGRTGSLPTLALTPVDPPLMRFLEQVLIHYPGIELVCEATLSVGKDPYLADHVLDGDLLFPAVMGLEAMTQAAAVLDPELAHAVVLTNVKFERPIVVPRDGELTIRLVALIEDGVVQVAVRTADTGFAVDHFRATISRRNADCVVPQTPAVPPIQALAFDPRTELYGSVLFQGKRFQRLRSYRTAAARRAVADLEQSPRQNWFAPYLPQTLLLSDPGSRDAMMHSLQCCVPNATLLPQGIARLVPALQGEVEGDLTLAAGEVAQDGAQYTYDLACSTAGQSAVEIWEGLRLHAVHRKDPATMAWVPALTAAFLERDMEHFGARVEVAVEPHPAQGQEGRRGFQEITEWAVQRLRPGAKVRRRPDGRLLIDTGDDVCSAHHERFTMAVLGSGPIACDTEVVEARDALTWQGLLGDEWELARQVASTTDCTFDEAATRVWGAMECVRKAGHQRATLSLGKVDEGRVVLNSGPYAIVTWALPLSDDPRLTMFAILGGN